MKKLSPQDVANLWQYYFNDAAVRSAKTLADHVDVAVFGSATHTLLRHGRQGLTERPYADELLATGRLLLTVVLKFRQMFTVTPSSLTFDMDDGRSVYAIPFHTNPEQRRGDEDGTIDTVVVLFGTDLAIMAFEFTRLSNEGWDEVGPRLPTT